MFDMLTFDELYALHSVLFRGNTRTHQRMMTADGRALMSVFSPEWAVLAASHAETHEMQLAVSAELRRRAAEAHADA